MRLTFAATLLCACLWAPRALAQAPTRSDSAADPAPPMAMGPTDTAHSMPMGPPAPLGIVDSRIASGTSWVPDASVMHAAHFTPGSWVLMLHGMANVQFDAQFGPRGAALVQSINWAMLMANHPLAGGRVQLRGMLSAEPATVGGQGYPLLLQTGESYQDAPLHDRQHPHDLFMELAALFDRAVGRDVALELYLAAAGEPALGPPAYMHRPSAMDNHFAPLGHHWQDGTHIQDGVLTAGIYTRTIKVEGSWFNGREPTDRVGLELRGFDSYSGRLTVNPSPAWSLSASYGYLASPEELEPADAIHRVSVSAIYVTSFAEKGEWASAIIYGGNLHSEPSHWERSALAETDVTLDEKNAIFARGEWVEKSAQDLAIADQPTNRIYPIVSLSAGYTREVASPVGLSIGVGGLATLDVVPSSLEHAYGSRTPGGLVVFVQARARGTHATMPAMDGMPGMTH